MAVLRRAQPHDLVAGVMAIGAFGLLISMGRGATFYADEWVFITIRPLLELESLFRPHNEHWSTLLVVMHRGLFELIGLRSYLPYLAVLLCLHVLTAWAAYLLVIPYGRLLALVVLGLVLLFGPGWENLFWAFQMASLTSMAAGLWAVIVIRRGGSRAGIVAALLLLVALAASGVGLYFVPAVIVAMWLAGRPRRDYGLLLIPIAAYALWYLTYGRRQLGVFTDPLTLEAVGRIPEFVVTGGAVAMDAALGIGTTAGAIVFVGIVVVVLLAVARGGHPDFLLATASTTLLAQYALIGLVRGHFGADVAALSRYAYSAGIFALLALAAMWGTMVGGRLTPMRAAPLLIVGALALAHHVDALQDGASIATARAADTRAIVSLMLEHEGHPAIDPEHRRLFEQPYRVPSPAVLTSVVATYGSPLSDALVPAVVPPIADDKRDAAQVELVRDAIVVRQRATGGGDPPRLLASAGVTEVRGSEELRVRRTATGEEASSVDVALPADRRLAICPQGSDELDVWLGQLAEPTRRAAVSITAVGGECSEIRVPSLTGRDWQVRIFLTSSMGVVRLETVD